jgi:hypothetical protein
MLPRLCTYCWSAAIRCLHRFADAATRAGKLSLVALYNSEMSTLRWGPNNATMGRAILTDNTGKLYSLTDIDIPLRYADSP